MKYSSYKVDVFKVANYILCKASPEIGDAITNLKLQKLLYYSQGFVLAITGKSLFVQPIFAWEHGPVVKEVYDHYKSFKANGIEPEEKGLKYYKELKDKKLDEIIDEVWEVYGQFSAWKLRNITHSEPPWQATPKGCEISLDSLHEYFKTRLK